MDFGRLDDGVESCGINVEYAAATPTGTVVVGISVAYEELGPTATVSGISWENGGLDSVVKSWEFISVFIYGSLTIYS